MKKEPEGILYRSLLFGSFFIIQTNAQSEPQTNEDQDDTTGDLSIFAKFSSTLFSKKNSSNADDKCGDADETDGRDDIYF